MPKPPRALECKAATPPRLRPRESRSGSPFFLIGAIVLFAVGIGVGATTSISAQRQLTTARSELVSAHKELSATRGTLDSTRDTLITMRGQLQDARTQASQANANAAAKYAADEARLAAKQRTLASDERALKTLEGDIEASAISADGVYVVGKDIKAGTWHTTGDGGQGGNECYYATLNSTNTSDINDNNNFDGSETVSLSGVYAFQISGPCTWNRTGP